MGPVGHLTCPAGSATQSFLPSSFRWGRQVSISGCFPPPSCLFWLHVRACLMENKTKEVIS